MTVTEVRSPERPTADDAALVASLKRPRYEIFPLDGVEDEVARHIPAEVKLTITASPSKGMEPTLKLAERLRRRGYDVVPHLSARLVRDREHRVVHGEIRRHHGEHAPDGSRVLLLPVGDGMAYELAQAEGEDREVGPA